MPRHPDILRPTRLELWLPEDLRAKLDLLLLSPTQGRVVRGSYKNFFMKLLTDYLEKVAAGPEAIVDLGELSGIHPTGRLQVHGSAEAIKQLKIICGK